jgi:hypothetical protein
MRPRDTGLDNAWEAVSYRYERRGRRVPLRWRALWRAVHALLWWGAR